MQNTSCSVGTICILARVSFIVARGRARGWKRLSLPFIAKKDFLIALELRAFKGPGDVVREYIGMLGNTLDSLP